MNHEAKVKTTGTWTDRFGALASGLCAAHCAICALAPALFAVVGLGALLSHEVELALTLVALGFGGATLMLSWREHRSAGVLSLLTVGMLGLMVSSGPEMAGEQHDHHGCAERVLDPARGRVALGELRQVEAAQERRVEQVEGGREDEEDGDEHYQ